MEERWSLDAHRKDCARLLGKKYLRSWKNEIDKTDPCIRRLLLNPPPLYTRHPHHQSDGYVSDSAVGWPTQQFMNVPLPLAENGHIKDQLNS
jgi:hypothetical protein